MVSGRAQRRHRYLTRAIRVHLWWYDQRLARRVDRNRGFSLLVGSACSVHGVRTARVCFGVGHNGVTPTLKPSHSHRSAHSFLCFVSQGNMHIIAVLYQHLFLSVSSHDHCCHPNSITTSSVCVLISVLFPLCESRLDTIYLPLAHYDMHVQVRTLCWPRRHLDDPLGAGG